MSEEVIRQPMFPPDMPEVLELPIKESTPPHRLTVVERVYHQHVGRAPLQIESKFVQSLTVDEPCYFRPACRANADWQPLDFGWLKDGVGTIILQNTSGQYQQRVPTPEAQKELDATILEVGVVAPIPIPFALVPPKHNLRIMLLPDLSYLVRCQSGQAEFNLYAIPR